jgi:hypothetical protein
MQFRGTLKLAVRFSLFSADDLVDPVTIQLRFLQRLQVRLGSVWAQRETATVISRSRIIFIWVATTLEGSLPVLSRSVLEG